MLIRVRAVLMAVLLAAAGLLGVAILSPAAQAADTTLVGNLTAPDGTDYPSCRMKAVEPLGPLVTGTRRHLRYHIVYEQLAR